MDKILHDPTMGIMVYSLLWVMQDFVHQPYQQKGSLKVKGKYDETHETHIAFLAFVVPKQPNPRETQNSPTSLSRVPRRNVAAARV